MSRVFLDANVLFSAGITSSGNARALFELADQYEEIELLVSAYVLEEATTNLRSKYPEKVPELLRIIDGAGYVPEPPEELLRAVYVRAEKALRDPKDIPVLAAAVYAEADLLISGDRKHFGKLYGTVIGGCTVFPLAEGLQVLLESL